MTGPNGEGVSIPSADASKAVPCLQAMGDRLCWIGSVQ